MFYIYVSQFSSIFQRNKEGIKLKLHISDRTGALHKAITLALIFYIAQFALRVCPHVHDCVFAGYGLHQLAWRGTQGDRDRSVGGLTHAGTPYTLL